LRSEHGQVVGQQAVAAPYKFECERRLAVAPVAGDRQSPIVDAKTGGVQWVHASLVANILQNRPKKIETPRLSAKICQYFDCNV
jgi:hypothetical protein